MSQAQNYKRWQMIIKSQHTFLQNSSEKMNSYYNLSKGTPINNNFWHFMLRVPEVTNKFDKLGDVYYSTKCKNQPMRLSFEHDCCFK